MSIPQKKLSLVKEILLIALQCGQDLLVFVCIHSVIHSGWKVLLQVKHCPIDLQFNSSKQIGHESQDLDIYFLSNYWKVLLIKIYFNFIWLKFKKYKNYKFKITNLFFIIVFIIIAIIIFSIVGFRSGFAFFRTHTGNIRSN